MDNSLEARIAAVPEHLRDALRKRLAGESAPAEADTIPRVSREGPLPLSFAQQRLWFLNELEPGTTEYNSALAMRLYGELDLPALTGSLQRLVDRHEALRTTFDSVDGAAVQIVHPPYRLDVSVVDSDEAGLRQVLDDFNQPFDLRVGPLFRAMVVRLGAEDHLLVIGAHHIVVDGWSFDVLCDELSKSYRAAVEGATVDLPDVRAQYPDYAVWQRENNDDASKLDYWKKQLAGIAPLELPTDRPRPPVRTQNGALRLFDVPRDVTDQLRKIAQDTGSTLFMVLLAACKVLFSRYSGQEDISLGTVTAARNRPELSGTIGFFVNTVVVRSQVDGGKRFLDFLLDVKATVLDALAHDEVPFDRLVDALQPQRDPSRTPLFQAMVVLRSFQKQSLDLKGLRSEEFSLPRDSSTFDISLEFQERNGALLGVLEYNTDLFDAATVERMITHLQVLLEGIVPRLDRPVGELPWLTGAERTQVTTTWNDTAVDYEVPQHIHALFERQVALRPDEPAVRFDGSELTFAELDKRANQVANALVAHGVRPGVLVGLCVERGLDMVVGLLGVLKAGGAYVPLDPGYPADRLEFMLSDSAAPVLLTQRALVAKLPKHDAKVLFLEDGFHGEPVTAPSTAVGPDDLAYVIYTSGSSGTPKGVMITHRNLAYIADAWDRRFGLTGKRLRFVSVTTLAVDLFFSDLLRSAFFGGAMIIAPTDVVTDPPRLLALVDEVGGTAIELVPTLANALVEELVARDALLPLMGLVSVGSEGWRAEDCARLVERTTPGTLVINAYGSTEVTVDSTVFEPSRETLPDKPFVPIGRPLANTRVYVLDPAGQPVPVGVPGELHIGGDGVGAGYWRRPELTAQRFGPDPFHDGGRVYRTGDRVRFLPDGTLEFLGRVDDQVKIRGFRIEPGEVEAALSAHPGLSDAAVVARPDESGRLRLVGYAVLAPGSTTTVAQLRAHLEQALPSYMVPSAFLILDALPLTPNGKIDRRNLPDPDGPTETGAVYVAPRTPTEEKLAEIWAKVLRVERVGVDDDFFALGGDSILSIQVVSRARRVGVRLTAKDIFVHHTIGQLAAIADRGAAPVAKRVAAPTTAPLTPVQHWFFEAHTAMPDHYAMSTALDLVADFDEKALQAALVGVVTHHDALRTRFRKVNGEWQQDIAPVDPARLVLRHAEGDAHAAALAAQSSMDLASGDLVRAVLIDGTTFFLAIHHLVVDGVSWRILLEDLETAYQQVLSGQKIDLGPKTTAFTDWAARLNAHVRDGGLDAEIPHWSAIHDGKPALPVDRDGPNTAGSARMLTVRLDRATTDALLHQVPGVYRTQVNDVLISAMSSALASWTGSQRVLMGMEGHGREETAICLQDRGIDTSLDDVDLSRTVGWFTTHFPVALTVPTGDWGDVLKSVKEQLRAVPGKGLGYDALRYLVPSSPMRPDPLPCISFNYHGQWHGTTERNALYRDARFGDLGQDMGPDELRPYLIDVVGIARDGELEITWLYSENVHEEATVRRLADQVNDNLRRIVEHCALPGAGGATPSDFPLARLDQSTVDRIMASGRVEDIYPLTPMQSGMLFHSLVGGTEETYFDQMSLRLDGVTDPGALAAAWQRVVDRTPILRSTVVWQDIDKPVQVVRSDVEVPVQHHDWRGLSDEDQRAEIARVIAEDTAAGMDLSTGPLVRLIIGRLSDTSVQMIRTSHHILLDGWSLAEVMAEVFETYRALAAGSEPDLPSRRPFRDYIDWIQQQDAAAAEKYWKRVVGGIDAPTELPYDRRPTTAHTSKTSGSVRIEFTEELTERLYSLAKDQRLTMNTVVQGAWALLLGRYGGELPVCFGTTVSGRPAELPGVETMIGLFINTLPVRVAGEADDQILPWLHRIQGEQIEARRVEFVALTQIQGWSGVGGGVNLFDSLVVFENYPFDGDTADGGIAVREVDALDDTNYPLTISAYPLPRFTIDLSYDAALFDRSTVDRMARHLRQLLTGMAENPFRTLVELPMIDPEERRELMPPRTAVAARHAVVHELVAAQVAASPDAIALVCGEDELSYGELDARANGLAHVLVGRGVRPGVLVAVGLDRGIDLVVALLAVLKAGGAYVPLDLDYPADRLEYMLSDSGAAVLLTNRARPESSLDVIRLDGEWPTAATAPSTAVGPSDLAYVIYTSGSTGNPKGVMVEHRNLCSVAEAWNARYGLVQMRPRHLSVASASFDVFHGDLLRALCFGGTMVICPRDVAADPARLLAEIERTGATALELVPTMAKALLAFTDRFPPLKILSVGSETWHTEDCLALLDRLDPDTYVVNSYGVTEAAIDSCLFEPSRAALDGRSSVPIGRPLANTRCYVLDRAGDVVPLGVAGELHIGGAGVARGYLNQPELTAERFVDDPFVPGERLYRTGDRVRLLISGDLEYVGRMDDQVKVRGFRVEPGEVEAVLVGHPAVREVAAVARSNRLIAYVVAGNADAATLRSFAAESLPAHLVPSAFVPMDALPLTPNGKIDRRALPAPDGYLDSGTTYVAPSSRAESVLADIWAEVLGVPRVGVRDNFFDLGGDSILSIQVISRIRSALAVDISPRALFTTPTVEGLAAALEDTPGTAEQRIPRVEHGQDIPLSFAQQRLWFLDEFAPGGAEYNTCAALRLTGELDVRVLQDALTSLVARHESLRTTFDSVDGRGVQRIHPPAPVPLPVVDVDPRELDRALAEEVGTPFDLRTGPLLRARLLRLSEDPLAGSSIGAETEHVLVLSLHHIITDGWSMGVLVDELGVLYAAGSLPDLDLRYSDYAVWQREQQSGPEFAGKLDYWREKLDGLTPLELPTDRPRPPVKTANGAVHRFDLPPEVLAGLNAVGRSCGATLFMTLVAATKLLLARYSGQRDIAVGTVTSGRDRVELERLIGFFVNTLVLRSTVDMSARFTDFLGEVRECALGAFGNADVPFERLVEILQPERDPSRTPLVQALVVLQNTPSGAVDLDGLRIEELALPATMAIFDVSFEFTERDGGLIGLIEYNTDLFDAATVERMAGHLTVLLEAVIASPGTELAKLPMLTEPERRQLTEGWNDTAVETGPLRCVHELVEAQARNNPQAVAVTCEGSRLTYRELDGRANQLAHHLVALGVRPGTLVAVSMERGLDLVVALLAVLKAGGAYVPLDPDYPAERLAFMLADTAAPVLLTQSGLAPGLETGSAAVVRVDADAHKIAKRPSKAPETGVTPDDLAYVIYTSGSTGTPKGVQVEHRSVANLLATTRAGFGFGPDDVWSVFHSYAFDFSVWEIWGGLGFGGRIVVVPRSVARAPELMWALLAEEGVTVLNQTPSSFGGLVRTAQEAGRPAPEELRLVIFGGEALEPVHVRQWFEGYPEARTRLVNMYGITETTVHVTRHDLDWAEISRTGRVGIGGPLPNYRAYLLDEDGNQVPVGVAGELFIGGAGVARGYLNRPDLTAERFVEDPFFAGRRMYRTGDVAKYLADGTLVYLGRTDDQVKIRGFRIELGEIEAALCTHPGVTTAVVVAREDTPGVKRLVAYVVGAADDLREHLRRLLPEHMVPAAFVELDALPLSPSGKINRRALPAPDHAPCDEFVAPEPGVEAELAAIWSAVLGVERVGATDNFFDLGGDSILSIQVVSAARKAGHHLATKDMFTHQTVRELAGIATTATAAADTGPVTGSAPLTPIQSWFFAEHPVRPDHFGMSMYLELAGDARADLVRKALESLVAKHDALRSRFERVDGAWRQHLKPVDGTSLSFRVADVADAEAEALAAQSGHNLADGPLVCAVFLTGGESPRLFLSIHHTVVDGVSWRILVEDFAIAYQGGDLGSRTTSYVDWSTSLRDYVAAGKIDAEVEHWTGAAAAVTPLPVDRKGLNTNGSRRNLSARLTVAETELLLRKVPGRYRTQINDVLLGAVALGLSEWTGSDTVVVDVEGHGREDILDGVDLSRTVGWFTTIYPVALTVPAGGGDDWRALAKAVRARLRAVPGRGIGYGALKYLGAHPALAEAPNAQVSFNYLGQWDTVIDGAGGTGVVRRQLDGLGRDQADDQTATHVLDVVGGVHGGELEITWQYSENLHDEATVRRIADRTVDALRQLVRGVAG
ncbi:non-ribosomal peptide synthetase [Allokutzneria albata]|uniref:Non-ribosomal peptide synthase domain TIGR01720/amino acid adenylation domain-containing protein n=1 Tax=Allokutzneria albata TaxID=211114 RepID=A0A1G9UCG6_ALLAB|nr:non-ribosomal peptide synthetase [Allokutzneria albata]SDM57636.1 non-ribosomal peptide synthase domain TIGR01720/amino acid adenylation domain-containing protein [Allokutzneria albata]